MFDTSPRDGGRSAALVIPVLLLLSAACARERSESEPLADRADTRAPAVAVPSDPSVTAPSDTSVATPPDPAGATDDRPAIVFLGNSLTAGLGVDPTEAFPALIQAKLDSAGLPHRVVNAGVSGETTAGGLRRIEPLLGPEVAVLVVALGGNDALRGVSPDSTRRNLQAILDRARARCPGCEIVLAGMLAPPNLGPTYADAFRNVFQDLGERSDVTWIPFLLEGVAGEPELNQADGIHPTPRGHEIMAETVWRALRSLLAPTAAARTGG